MLTNAKGHRCYECGTGTVRPTAEPGRRDWFRGVLLDVPDNLAIPTCDNCGTQWMDDEAASAFDAAMESRYRLALRHRLDSILVKISAATSLRQVEMALGLSQGYLSKLKRGEREPSAELVASLHLIALDVDGALAQLSALWSNEAAAAGRARQAARNSA
jgi:transcriptional regulator with XRE-family HTH domain